MGQVKCLHEDCEYSAEHVGQLQAHIKTAHSNNVKTYLFPFPCPQCDKKYRQESHLSAHIDYVHDNKRFTCQHCSNKFSQKEVLKAHINSVHKSYGKSMEKGDLKAPINSVTKTRIPCPHCNHQAKQKAHLEAHIRSVHDGIKFPCPHCEHKATRAYSIKKKHKISSWSIQKIIFMLSM